MMIFGNEDTYGRVLEYSQRLDESDEDSPNGAVMEHLLRESMSFADGLVVLGSQDKLLRFFVFLFSMQRVTKFRPVILLAIVSKILSDLDLTVLTPGPPMPASILDTTFQWKSSARTSAMKPYTAPPVFSIDDIAALMDSQYELASQHLGDLRTDPIYLAETLQSYYDHRIETLLNKAPAPLIQSRATMPMLSDAYTFLAVYISFFPLYLCAHHPQYFHTAKGVIKKIRVVQQSFPNGVPRARELPAEYENALMMLYPIFALLEDRIRKGHHQTICGSPAMRAGESISTLPDSPVLRCRLYRSLQ
jgi:hypothetical protein